MDSGLGDAIQVVQDLGTTTLQADQDLIPEEKQEIAHIINDTTKDDQEIQQDAITETSKSADDGALSSFLASCGINLFLPFINGVMLGFGEILAHEIGFRYGWFFAKVSPPRRITLRNSSNMGRRVGASSVVSDASILL